MIPPVRAKDFRVESAGDPHSKRILRGGEIVAMLLQYANGRWAVREPMDGPPIVAGSYPTPAQGLAAYVVHLRLQAEAQESA